MRRLNYKGERERRERDTHIKSGKEIEKKNKEKNRWEGRKKGREKVGREFEKERKETSDREKL